MPAIDKKTIAIVGATGKQGGSVAKSFLSAAQSSRWHVRCLTRKPSSEAAKGLAALGAEIVQADLSSVPSLISGFASAHAVFVNTNYWEVYRGALAAGKSDDEASQLAYNSEITWGKNAATAAAQIPELERFVYSAFGSMKVASGGKYARCHHFETKGVVVAYISTDLPQLAAKASYIYASSYSDNPLLYPHRVPFGTPWIVWLVSKLPFLVRCLPNPPAPHEKPQAKKASEGGQYLMVLPAKMSRKIPVFIPHMSTGGYVRCLVEDEPAGTKLLAVDWWIGLEEGMKTWEKVTGRKAYFVEVTVELLCRMTGLKEEVVDGGAYLAEFPYMCEVTDYIEPSGLRNPPPPVMSFEDYLRSRNLQELLA
ncbi:uncharacterized protein Z520_03747 [Fonsecaea multimorphosa CBS 102226]|uniref:NmrA-like domain-containing protein n=1 Tax=Fonsecaea multimorphosa CBS 102226 TaxID=1442371 RepID=A0A0D2ISW7_9EURO|nr:uncharacterized protein Z520_03747 [Fonsecaea multimorphosa CBS 102226]KIY00062.1 hypothetical protein Z520_03747 [Fonsecaea multimorphosa CBS 102226]OAL27262.1 hypothetical protein AYO22_03537 [Fonsecaea multimorphosa]